MAFFVGRRHGEGALIALCLAIGVLLAGFTTGVNEERKRGVRLPVIMYHSILKDEKRAGKYVVSPDTLEKDLRYLKENGYETVVVSDLIAYVDEGTPLPEKPVMITLDDGYYNNLVYLPPILEALDMKAVVSVVGEFTDTFTDTPDPNPNYGHLSWDEIRKLSASGHVEIQNHSYTLHHNDARKGAAQMRGESDEEYSKMLTKDLSRMQTALLERSGVAATAFTYPLGATCDVAEGVVKELGLRCSLSCYEHMNTITRDAECLYCLGRYNRPSGISTEMFMKKALN